MDTLRTLVSSLSHFDPGANDLSPDGRYRTSVTLTAQVGTVVATAARIASGGGIIDPDPALNHAANFLYMLTGKRPSRSKPGRSMSRWCCTPTTSSMRPRSRRASRRRR